MRRSLVATAAIAAIALAGCTNGDGGSGTPGPTSGQADPAAVAYMDKVCGSASEFAKVDKTAPKLDAGDPAKLKAEMAAYMGQLADAFTKSAAGLKGVGPSPVAGGDEAVTKMSETFTALGTLFTDAKVKIEQADANDATGGLQAAGEAISKLSELADPLKDLKAVPELQKAAQSAQRCQEMQGLGVAPTS
ncbi:hypothetical protein [Nocardia sp. NRRL S-836]|uniref:hypothetical protein n=1 Tax=Nocardia sp. NRRL S-836 TaxID=1519492 RepID=UPI0006AE2CAF|nr:hypothetical protein [Nocardia sp. NRRL S-836]KOV78523.1 hypothetical protein ADL03_39830 [Nocardia sp. NRRL S-836]